MSFLASARNVVGEVDEAEYVDLPEDALHEFEEAMAKLPGSPIYPGGELGTSVACEMLERATDEYWRTSDMMECGFFPAHEVQRRFEEAKWDFEVSEHQGIFLEAAKEFLRICAKHSLAISAS